MSDTSLQERVARLEAIEEIKQLKYVYMDHCDNGYRPKELGAQFVEDAVWDGGEFGRHVGRAAIEEFFAGISSDIVFAAHLALNPIIEVDGDRATARWRLIMPATMMIDGAKQSRWILGDYRDQCVRRDGRWMFQDVDFFVNFNAPALEGWTDLAAIRP